MREEREREAKQGGLVSRAVHMQRNLDWVGGWANGKDVGPRRWFMGSQLDFFCIWAGADVFSFLFNRSVCPPVELI